MDTEGLSRLCGMAPDRGDGVAVTLRMMPLSTGPLLGAFLKPILLSRLCLNPASPQQSNDVPAHLPQHALEHLHSGKGHSSRFGQHSRLAQAHISVCWSLAVHKACPHASCRNAAPAENSCCSLLALTSD